VAAPDMERLAADCVADGAAQAAPAAQDFGHAGKYR
jgi:hypothetical protein